MITTRTRVGVLLMTYGSPATLDDIPVYLQNVRGGRPADEELVQEFRRRYALIGGSPLLRITQQQAAALEKELNDQHPDGPTFQVMAGMRFAPPFVADLVPQAAAGAQQLLGIIMSPQYSPIIMSGYARALDEAVVGYPGNVRQHVPVLFTAHSMPKRVIEKEPNYISHLQETAASVAALVG